MKTNQSPGPRPLTSVLDAPPPGEPAAPASPPGAKKNWSPPDSRSATSPSPPRQGPDGLPWCETCKGARYVRLEVPVDHPDFGKAVPCTACKVVLRQRLRIFDRFSSRIGRALRQRFDNFRLNGEQRAAAEAFQHALCFASRPSGWLILYGPTGNGKSHLAAAVANYLIEEKNRPVLFLTAPDFLNRLRWEIRAEGTTYYTLLDAARNVDVLILDDLGAENLTEWAEETLFVLFNYRYQALLPTMVITNLKPEDLPPRIASRVFDRTSHTIVLNPAPDYRLQGAALADG